MTDKGLKSVREMTGDGFYYDNLINMAQQCREESSPDRILGAYILNRFFVQLADELGDGPVIVSDLRKLEARYRTALNLALEAVVAGSPQEEQNNKLITLIQLLWSASRVGTYDFGVNRRRMEAISTKYLKPLEK